MKLVGPILAAVKFKRKDGETVTSEIKVGITEKDGPKNTTWIWRDAENDALMLVNVNDVVDAWLMQQDALSGQYIRIEGDVRAFVTPVE